MSSGRSFLYRAKNVQDINLEDSTSLLPEDHALGLLWDPNRDVFKFRISLKETPMTRHGIISAVNSIYDPLGFCAPVMLEAKLIQQELCRIETYEGAKLGWHDPIPPELEKRWMSWKTNLPILERVEIPRCFQPRGFSTPVSAQLHHFGDASNLAYGCSSYRRLVDQNGQIHVSFVIWAVDCQVWGDPIRFAIQGLRSANRTTIHSRRIYFDS